MKYINTASQIKEFVKQRVIRNHTIHKYTPLFLFALLFVILGMHVYQLRLYLDDTFFLYPAIQKDYLSHFVTYMTNYGIFRPLTLVYYYFIYSLYLVSPGISHVLMLGLFICSNYLIFRILILQKLPYRMSLLISLFLCVLPWAVEGFGWLAAGSSVIVYFLFFFSIYLIEKYPLSQRLLTIIFLLLYISTFVYESTIFAPITMALFWMNKKGHLEKKYFSEIFRLIVVFSIPVFLYFMGRIVLPGHVEQRFTMVGPEGLLIRWVEYIESLSRFLYKDGIVLYWIQTAVHGFRTVISSLSSFVCGLVFFGFIGYHALFKRYTHLVIHSNTQVWILWLTTFILSLIPLSFSIHFISFRVLIYPSTLFILSLVHFYETARITIHTRYTLAIIGKMVLIPLMIYFLCLQIGMIVRYKEQFNRDEQIAKEIGRVTKNMYRQYPFSRTYVYIDNIPLNMVDNFVYGEYLRSIYTYFWSAEYFLRYINGSWDHVAIAYSNGSPTQYSIENTEYFTSHPLSVFRYTDTTSCKRNDCISVMAIED